MLMKNPPHPGRIIQQECLAHLGLTVMAEAKGLGVTRKTLFELLNGKSGISLKMGIRLSCAFGGAAETWLGIQMDHDRARALKRSGKLTVRPLAAGQLERV